MLVPPPPVPRLSVALYGPREGDIAYNVVMGHGCERNTVDVGALLLPNFMP